MNFKLHAMCDSQESSINLFVTAGQVSDYIAALANFAAKVFVAGNKRF